MSCVEWSSIKFPVLKRDIPLQASLCSHVHVQRQVKPRIPPFAAWCYPWYWFEESDKSLLCPHGYCPRFYKICNSPTLFPSNLKQCREFSPPQGQRIQSIPLYSPTYSPGWPSGLPLGQANDMCIKLNHNIILLLKSWLNHDKTVISSATVCLSSKEMFNVSYNVLCFFTILSFRRCHFPI